MTGNIKEMNSDWELAVLTGLVGAVGVRLSVSVPGVRPVRPQGDRGR